MCCGFYKLNGIGICVPENLISEDALPEEWEQRSTGAPYGEWKGPHVERLCLKHVSHKSLCPQGFLSAVFLKDPWLSDALSCQSLSPAGPP